METAPPLSRRWFVIQAIVVFVVTFVAHSSSLRNQYAFDDELLILRNIAVQRGIRGIGEIFSTHMFSGYFESVAGEAPQANRHYRPMPVTTFAVEQSVFGDARGDEYRAALAHFRESAADQQAGTRLTQVQEALDTANRDIAMPRHVVQVVLYAVSMVVLLFFLARCVFPGLPLAAFAGTLVFALHPIHTEVVANLKSREELLSLLFILLTGIFVFEYDRTRKRTWMAAAILPLSFALLSKEYGIVAPFVLAAALVLVRGRSVRAVVISIVLPLMIPVVLYLVLRQSMVGGGPPVDLATQDILIDPFLKLRTGEAAGSILATKIDIVDHYLRLLVYPRPLSSDYSYATFPYQTFASPAVWTSLLIHLALIGATIFAWMRRHILALAGIVYFGFFLLVQVGATMGERLVYHASLGFALLLGWAIARLPRPAAALLCVAVAVPYAVVSFHRDAVWKDNRTLFFTDVKTSPRSALLNANVGGEILSEALDRVRERQKSDAALTPADQAFIKRRAGEALVYLNRAVSIHDRFANAWINAGIAHYYREEWDDAGKAFARAAAITPGQPSLRQYAANFHMLGVALGRSGNLAGAAKMFLRAAEADPEQILYWQAAGAAAFNSLQFADAKFAFGKMLELQPQNLQPATAYRAAAALDRLTQATIDNPRDPLLFEELASNLDRSPNPAFAAAAKRARETSERLRTPQ